MGSRRLTLPKASLTERHVALDLPQSRLGVVRTNWILGTSATMLCVVSVWAATSRPCVGRGLTACPERGPTPASRP